MDIDWDSAPTGATHLDTSYQVFCCATGFWGCDNTWFPETSQPDWGTKRYIPRPVSALDQNAFTDPVSELLAVVHRDGGQYENTHGRDKAIRDAYGEIYTLRQQLAEAKRVIKIIADLDLKTLAS